ncbi:hypothetical protein C8A01DRAFT_40855 [Parachaetomium inaequale]|uniref:Uncharacterized protein n=1 Tax=Parachaetomium inaequale TaxID=2588326 RepID=A0AAN6SMG9_9PEZI|nr:hypothetical protein C8A01DRAFT_40855 [Parachaetomium inaequale]
MKTAVIAAALAFAIGASATVKIEHGTDGSFKAISVPTVPDTLATPLKKLARSAGCSSCRDRCLKAVISASNATPEFCTSFLAATYTAPADFAPIQTQCAGAASRVSSACSCFVKPTPSPSTTSTSSTETSSTSSATPIIPSCSPPGGHCTLDTFIQDCCSPDGSGSGMGCYFATGDPQNGVCFW